MMNNLNGKDKIVSTIVDISAGIMAILALFAIYNSYNYISGLVQKGLKISEQLPNVINVYVNSVTPYVFYAICLFSISYIIKKCAYKGQAIINDDIEAIESIDEEMFFLEEK